MASRIGFDGLASGLQTSEIIAQLMAIERLPLQRLQAQKNQLKASQDAWRDVNMRLSNLDSKLTALTQSATFLSRTAASSDEKVVTVTATRDAEETSYSVKVEQLATAHRIVFSKTEWPAQNKAGEFKINGVTVDVKANATAKDVAEAINQAMQNAASDELTRPKVKASVIGGHLVLEGLETGEGNEIELEDVEGRTILQDLGLLNQDREVIADVNEKPTNAVVIINGVQITRPSNTIRDAVEGLTFQLKGEGEATVTIGHDTARAVKAVEEFVAQYNSTMEFIRSRLAYNAETGQAGALQGDSTLMRIEMYIRRAVTDNVAGDLLFKNAASVGISIDRYGVMTLDANKLREALAEDPEAVAKLFMARQDQDGFDGIATRLDNYLKDLLQANTGLIPKRVESYDARMKVIDRSVESMELRLEKIEERYYRQFIALEQALGALQAQQDWLSNQLIGLQTMNLYTRSRR